MIPLRLVIICVGGAIAMVALLSAVAWLRHDATERERGRAAAARADTLTRTEEARRAADDGAMRAADPAGELREHWRRPE
jgi:hypothetical protein